MEWFKSNLPFCEPTKTMQLDLMDGKLLPEEDYLKDNGPIFNLHLVIDAKTRKSRRQIATTQPKFASQKL